MSVGEITGTGRVLVGGQTFPGIRYRLAVEAKGGRHKAVRGTIEAAPDILSAIFDAGKAAIELAGGLGWFSFFVTDVDRGKIELTGPIKN